MLGGNWWLNMSSDRAERDTTLHDAVLNIGKMLPHYYGSAAELPQHLLMLLDQMEQNPVVQQQQQPQPKKE
jgi:hypothetical protein